ncbi:hypothetical protein ACFLWB_03015, partial [Chloroflexota bacterium]
IFWAGVIWAILWGVTGSISVTSTMHSLTTDELNQTIWALTGPLMIIWGIFGLSLGALVAVIGLLLYSGAKGSTVWKFGIGIFLTLVVGMAMGRFGHFPPLFGIGGTLIILLFIGILWLWAKERMALKGSSTTAADLRLVGYVFMLIGAWFVCGIAGTPFLKALEGQAPSSPIHVIIFLVLGWFFLFLSHYKSRKQQD